VVELRVPGAVEVAASGARPRARRRGGGGGELRPGPAERATSARLPSPTTAWERRTGPPATTPRRDPLWQRRWWRTRSCAHRKPKRCAHCSVRRHLSPDGGAAAAGVPKQSNEPPRVAPSRARTDLRL